MDKFTKVFDYLLAWCFDISNEVFIRSTTLPTAVSDTYVVDEGGILIVDSLNGLLTTIATLMVISYLHKDSDPKVLQDHQKVKKV